MPIRTNYIMALFFPATNHKPPRVLPTWFVITIHYGTHISRPGHHPIHGNIILNKKIGRSKQAIAAYYTFIKLAPPDMQDLVEDVKRQICQLGG